MMRIGSKLGQPNLWIAVACLMGCVGVASPHVRAQESPPSLDQQLIDSLGGSVEQMVEDALSDDPSSNKPAKELPAEDSGQKPAEQKTPPEIKVVPHQMREETGGFAGVLQLAQQEDHPLLIIAGGENCPWCTLLKQELQKEPLPTALKKWTLVEFDVDQSPATAQQLGVTVIPALRILSKSGTSIAKHDGYLEAADLAEWLEEHRQTAAEEADRILLDRSEPDTTTVLKLIQQLDQRDALRREAAISRLALVPQLASGPLVDAFAEGDLSMRLATLEVLQQWDAPVSGIDPWQPDSINEPLIQSLREWSSELKVDPNGRDRALSDEQLAEANSQIDRLLKVDLVEGEAIAARLSRHADALLPEVYRRLDEAETDDARMKLRALRYRLVANDSLVLRFPGGLARLASSDVPTRRQAAEQLISLATAGDQALFLELFSDRDSLIRELALKGLQTVGGEAATQTLVKLLSDPEPNVRAAVLKQLAEQASPKLLPQVAEYVKSETDPDLLVHALRYFREIPTEASSQAVLPLLSHDQWQVRAEAADAIREFMNDSEFNQNEMLVGQVEEKLLSRLDDEDGFVFSRVASALAKRLKEPAVEPFFSALERHPEVAPEVIKSMSYSTAEMTAVQDRFFMLLKHDSATLRISGIEGISRASDHPPSEWVEDMLNDPEERVRMATASVLFGTFHDQLESKKRWLIEGSDPRLSDGLELDSSPGNDPFGDPFGTIRKIFSAEKPKDEKKPADKPKPWDEMVAEINVTLPWPNAQQTLVPPLKEMMASEDPATRLLAASNLLVMGHKDETLPVIEEAVQARPSLAGNAAAILPWLPWEQRLEKFNWLLPMALQNDQSRQLFQAFTEPLEPRGAERLWEIVADKDFNSRLAGNISRAIGSSLTGEWYWRYDKDSNDNPAIKDQVIENAKLHLQTGNEWETLIALFQISNADPTMAANLAKEIYADEFQPQELRDDAYQIAFLYADPDKRVALAKEGLQSDNPKHQAIAVVALVLADEYDEFSTVRNELHFNRSYSSHFFSSSSSGPGPIIPKVIDGIDPETARDLLTHSEAKVRALAGYALAMHGDDAGLAELLEFWRNEAYEDSTYQRLVYSAIAKLNAGDQIETLREIASQHEGYYAGQFYWTIRIMSGDEVLQLRKELRDKFGDNILH